MPKIVFGIHTAELEHKISWQEARDAKAFFGKKPGEHLKDTTYFFPKGIDEIEILESPRKYNGVCHTTYTLRIRLNMTRAIGDSGYGIMPLTSGNLKKAASSISRILRETLQLSNQNNRLEEWTVIRLDTAFDINVASPELLVFLLNISLVLPKERGCKYDLPKDEKERKKRMIESVWFGNGSYNYNVYAKLREVENKIECKRKRGEKIDPLTAEEKARLKNILRIERQSKEKALKKLLPNSGKFKELSYKKAMTRILATMLDDIEAFWGKGDFYSGQKAMKLFRDNKTDIDGIRSELSSIYRWHECRHGDYSKELFSTLEGLGISPAFLTAEMSQVFQTDTIQGLYNTITAEYPRPRETRAYHDFPVPHKCADGRFKVTLSTHVAGESKSVKKYVSGRSLEECEKKVLETLNDVITGNRQKAVADPGNTEYRMMYEKSMDDRERFFKVAKSGYIKGIAKLKQSPDEAASGSGFEIRS